MTWFWQIVYYVGYPFRFPGRVICWLTGMSSVEVAVELLDIAVALIAFSSVLTGVLTHSVVGRLFWMALAYYWVFRLRRIEQRNLVAVGDWMAEPTNALPVEAFDYQFSALLWTIFAWLGVPVLVLDATERIDFRLSNLGFVVLACAMWTICDTRPKKRSAVRRGLDRLAAVPARRLGWST